MINKISTSKWSFLIPVVLALAVNANVLQNGFVWDDQYILVGGSDSVFGKAPKQGGDRTYHRPVVSWSYQLDGRLWGKNPTGFHFSNLMLHTANTLLVFLLGIRLMTAGQARGPAPTDPGEHKVRPYASPLRSHHVLPLIAGSLFAVHPAHAEAVAWIPGRNDLLPAFFLLVAMLCHHTLRERPGSRWPFIGWLIAAALALLSKESALPMVFLFPLYDLWVWNPPKKGWRRLLTPSTIALIPLVMGYLALRFQALGSASGQAEIAAGSSGGQFQSVLLSLGFYLKHLFFPFPLNAFILFPETHGLREMLYIVIAAVGAALLILTTLRYRGDALVFGLWAAFLGLALPILVPLFQVTHAPVAERYLYLPSIGFVFLAAGLLLKIGTIHRPIGVSAAVIVVVLFSGLSYSRNQTWSNDLRLWEDTVLKSPRAAVPHNLLGLVYRHEGRPDDAAREFLQASNGIGSPDTLALAANNLGGIYLQSQKFDEAEAVFRSALARDPDLTLAYYNLGVLYWERFQSSPRSAADGDQAPDARLAEARKYLIQAVIRNPDYAEAYYVLGLVHLAQNREMKARESFESAVRLDPSSPFGQDAARRLEELR